MSNLKDSFLKESPNISFPSKKSQQVNLGATIDKSAQQGSLLRKYKSSFGLFSALYIGVSYKRRIIVAIIAGIIFGLSSLLFVQTSGIYVAGLSGIFQAFARIARIDLIKRGVSNETANVVFQLIFYLFYFIANIPLIIFSYKKTGKKFTYLTTIFIAVSVGVPLALNQIPGANDLMIFGNTRSNNPNFQIDGQQVLDLLTFTDTELSSDSSKFILIFLYTFFSSLFNGFAASMIYFAGGCSGGMDFISFYFAYKKQKKVTKTLLTINGIAVFSSAFIGTFIASIVINVENANFTNFLSQNLISGILYVIFFTLVVKTLFPKDKVVKVQIYAENVMKIRDTLFAERFNHALTINTTIGGYSLTQKQNIEFVCMYIELPKIIKIIDKIPQQKLITITTVEGIDGTLRTDNTSLDK